MDQSILLGAFLTTMGAIFVAELTDKDALFLLALATKTRPLVVFAAGSLAFTVTTAIIVTLGSVLIAFVPVYAIKLVGGAIMLAYAVFESSRLSKEGEAGAREERLLDSPAAGIWSIFIPAVLTLVALDLAGDATELVTVVMLARFGDALLVFLGALTGLIAAVAVETALGNRLGSVLSPRRIKYLSVAVFLSMGTIVIATTVL